MSEPEILCDIRNHVAFVTLNRPAVLNALSLDMVTELTTLLRRCAQDDTVRAVMIAGAGGRAFCAGGDIRALYQSVRTGGSSHRAFVGTEYPLDFSLYHYPKPYIALLDGITMGGGMGIAQGSRLRIVGERTRMAMPEVSIGLFPDVGASYFLSRLGGSLGVYLAVTGVTIGGADALYVQLADLYLAPTAVASLAEDLGRLRWTADWQADIRGFLQARATTDAPPAPLHALRAAIDAHFSLGTVPAILNSLDGETREAYADWARRTAALLRTRSPTLLAVTLRQLQRGRTLSLADCFRMELDMVQHCFEHADFAEGVRALIIDKDNTPRWRPARLDEVTDSDVDAFFERRWPGEHPLQHLERSVAAAHGERP